MKFALVSAKENPEAFEIFLKELIDGNPMFESAIIDSPEKNGKNHFMENFPPKITVICCLKLDFSNKIPLL